MIRKIIVGVGLFLFFVVWGTVIVTLATNPGSWNTMTIVEQGEEYSPHGMFCNQVMFIENDNLYSICSNGESGFAGWTRLSPDNGEITPLVELERMFNYVPATIYRLRLHAEDERGNIVTLLWSRLATRDQWGGQDEGSIFAIMPADGPVEYIVPPEELVNVFVSGQGIAWDGEDFEVVVADEELDADLLATIYRYDRENGWQEGREIDVPDMCQDDCRLSHAYVEDGLWHFLVWSGDRQQFEMVNVADETGAVEELEIEARGSFDTGAGNVIPLLLSAYDQLYLYQDGWEAVPFEEIRTGNNVPIFTGVNWYQLEDSGLQIYPNGLQVLFSDAEGFDDTYEHRSWFWLDDRWIEVAQQNNQIAVREAGSDDFEPVVSNPMPVVSRSNFPPFARIVLLKNNLGDYWLVSAYGQYIQLNENFERTDSLSIPARFAALFDNFTLYEAQGWAGLFETNAMPKQVMFILLLTAYPLIGLGAYLVRRDWLFAGVIAAVVYTLIFVSGIVWFWQMIVYL